MNIKTEYQTLSNPSEGLYKEKGSKFISFAYPIISVDEAKSIIDQHKKNYFDARHVCYAYSVGPNRELHRYYDDGEPSGTAGKPIFGQILSANITNCLIIVVRYFGGVLLGTGGLITAYKEASLNAIQNSVVLTKQVTQFINVNIDFAELNNLMKLIKELNIKIINQSFDLNCEFELEIGLSSLEFFIDKLKNIDNLTFSIKENVF